MARIGRGEKEHDTLALGCWTFGGAQWGGQDDGESLRAMEKAYELGLRHFDTASGYGSGHSERLVGEFIGDKRASIFLASKQGANRKKEKYAASIRSSLDRLKTDFVDLYYIHWPSSKFDLRPTMEALVEAKEEGIVGGIGVSNFSVEQMEQVLEVGRIDANQLCYNLLWRWDERDIIPFCIDHDIAVVSYSSIAQGILTGKFPREPEFREGDQRPSTTLFDPAVWPHVYDGVEEMKTVAEDAGRSLTHLAIRWVSAQPGITSILVGARNADQVADNAAAMEGDIDPQVLERLSAISDTVADSIPDTGNIFRYYP